MTTDDQRRRVSFAAIDIGCAAVRSHIDRGDVPPDGLEYIAADAVAERALRRSERRN